MQILRAYTGRRLAAHWAPVLSVAIAGMLIVSLTVLFAASSVKAQDTETENTSTQVGELQLTGVEGSPLAEYALQLESMPDPPVGTHYELWILPDGSDPVRLAALAPVDGQLSLEGALADNRLAADALTGDFAFAISIEPDDDPQPDTPAQIAITSTLPGQFLPVFDALFVNDGLNDKGTVTGALEQTGIAIQHTEFISESIAADSLDDARNHAEHVINILDGQGGMFFGDLNRDGQAQNPGDGYGVRAYLNDAESSAQQLLDLANLSDDQQAALLQTVAALDDAQTLVASAREQATKFFAIDTADEANSIHDELAISLTQLADSIATANKGFVSLAVFPIMVDRDFSPVSTSAIGDTTAQDTAPQEVTPSSTDVQTSEPVTATEPVTITNPVTDTGTLTDIIASTETSTETSTATEIAKASSSVVPPPPNAEAGDTWTNPADGSVYHFVPGGEYSIGSEDDGASPREAPEHTVSVDSFWIQETETTNAQYARCVDDGACTEPDNDRWQDPDFANHPVANVSWDQAVSYSQWLGARLPSEAEWETACRGPDHNLYPWGEEAPYLDLANYGDAVQDTMPVGSYPEGVAASGALDMAGNVWEWTSSLDMAYPYDPNDGREASDADGKRIMRGGSFYYPELFLRCSARTGAAPSTQIPHLGFRTVLDGQ